MSDGRIPIQPSRQPGSRDDDDTCEQADRDTEILKGRVRKSVVRLFDCLDL